MQRLDRVVGLPGLDDAAQARELGRDGRRDLDDRLVAGGGALLRQVADRGVALPDDLAVVRRLLAQDDREQRGLASAVRPDQADPILTIQLQRDVGEQDPTAKRLRDTGQSEHLTRSMGDNGAAGLRVELRQLVCGDHVPKIVIKP